MDSDTALRLFENGAILLFENMPQGSQFGIDYTCWTTGPKFLGIKMIPPGLHFVYYSAIGKRGGIAPRMGFFHCFKKQEILVKKWDNYNEDVVNCTDEETIEGYRNHLKDLDPHLGAYPFDKFKTWFSLSNHLSKELAERLSPISGIISSQSMLETKEDVESASESSASTSAEHHHHHQVNRQNPSRVRFRDAEGLPIMTVRKGSELRFTPVGGRDITAKNTPAERTAMGMDSSAQLELLIGSYENENELLGELQFAFICFLIGQHPVPVDPYGQVYEGFESYKSMVALLCNSFESIVQRPKLYEKFLTVLFHQMKEIPKDFFVDIVSKHNFLTVTLSRLFNFVKTESDVEQSLKVKCEKLNCYFSKRFHWDFSSDSDEYEPVVVDL